MGEASLRLNFTSSFPNEYTSLTGTPFSWFEATYRYAEVKNKLYGPAAYSGNQSYKDKGFDLKFRLLKENYYLPALAVGMRDIAGTGNFSTEYIPFFSITNSSSTTFIIAINLSELIFPSATPV